LLIDAGAGRSGKICGSTSFCADPPAGLSMLEILDKDLDVARTGFRSGWSCDSASASPPSRGLGTLLIDPGNWPTVAAGSDDICSLLGLPSIISASKIGPKWCVFSSAVNVSGECTTGTRASRKQTHGYIALHISREHPPTPPMVCAWFLSPVPQFLLPVSGLRHLMYLTGPFKLSSARTAPSMWKILTRQCRLSFRLSGSSCERGIV